MTSAETTRTADYDRFTHPTWCDPSLCDLTAGVLLHEELGQVVPLTAGRTAVVARFRGDEISGDGEQVVWPVGCWLTVGDGEPVYLERPEDAEAVVGLLRSLSS